jgi:hypothetical protein
MQVTAYVDVFQLMYTWHVCYGWYILPRQNDRVLLGTYGFNVIYGTFDIFTCGYKVHVQVLAHVAAYVAVFQLIATLYIHICRRCTLPRHHDRVLIRISGVSA